MPCHVSPPRSLNLGARIKYNQHRKILQKQTHHVRPPPARSLLSAPVIKDKLGADYVAFDLNPVRVRQSKEQGFPVFYGDGTEPEVLKTAGMEDPKV